MTWNDFAPHEPIAWAAADTEAYTLIDGVRVDTADMLALAEEKPAKWWRAHVSVDVYAWLISDGVKTACFDNFEAFTDFCAEHRVSTLWWYNAKYDFAHIDYAVLTAGWSLQTNGKLKSRQYRSLHGAQGERYSFAWAKEYKNESRHNHTHITRSYDLCNIFGGGLERNLEAFNVTDYDGKPIRKLTMDYQGDNTDADARAYMDNDVLGLFHLVRTADDFLTFKWGYTLTGKKPDVMTAGGLAKRVLLSYYNGGSKDHVANIKHFQRLHMVDLSADEFYRSRHLYRGGITIINPAYQNKELTRPIYKYDINSMYPYQMSKMPDLIGRPYRATLEQWQTKYSKSGEWVGAYQLTYVDARMRGGMLPVWYDIISREYTPKAFHAPNDTPLLMFTDEFDELHNWYDIDDNNVNIDCVYMWRKAPAHAFKRFVADNYELKRSGKASGNKVQEAFAKLLLNSSYGKLAENPYKDITHREINAETGAVTLVDDGETIDEKCLLSVVLGALVTSMARVQLLQLIRAVCPVPALHFVYADTDSIASFTQYNQCDPYTLGALKDETVINGVSIPYTWAKYLAPKTYILRRETPNGIDIEIHSKGMPTKSIYAAVPTDGKIDPSMSVNKIGDMFAVGEKYIALAGMNVRGGKALVPVLKYICRPDNVVIHGHNNDPNNIELTIER